MKKSRLPTLQEIETLTSYLPRLYAEGFSPVISWGGGKMDDGTITLPYPKYNSVVEEFFYNVGSEGWIDYEYNPEQAYQMPKD